MSYVATGKQLGDLYRVYTNEDQEYKTGRMPALGSIREYPDGRKYKFVRRVGVGNSVSAGSFAFASEPKSVGLKGLIPAGTRTITTGSTPDAWKRNELSGYSIFAETTADEDVYFFSIIESNYTNSFGDQVITVKDAIPQDLAATGSWYVQVPNHVIMTTVNFGKPEGLINQNLLAIPSGGRQYLWIQIAGLGKVDLTTPVGTAADVGDFFYVNPATGAVGLDETGPEIGWTPEAILGGVDAIYKLQLTNLG